ncbi:sel1 repeat family protein [Alteromonas sp. 1_MG-2023]|uniref:tetratricopeptide repeat protein n=1 Tax=Alteromonas sp. 1_MG-2023 TaxID=3062669 RepID=UPI0026E27CC4|nr:sel1 repeat family protein [Alteromonas sp. 1_MG-2023]MDO6566065.1 sel1 repeat family protein [Alteromonas sp. 1_MG-2023]
MRGLTLAIIALLLIAGDSGRYAQQLVRNATSAIHAYDDSLSTQSQASEPATPEIADSEPATSNRTEPATSEQATSDQATSAQGTSVPESTDTSDNAPTSSNVSKPIKDSVYAMLWLAAQNEQGQSDNLANEQAQSLLVELASENHANYWLEQLASINNADAAWALYQLLGEEAASDRLIRLAALGNVAEAQLAFAMATENPDKREKWLIRAAEQGYMPAQAALADWYLLHAQPGLAKPWLEKTAMQDMQSAFKYGRLLWDENNREDAKSYILRAAKEGHKLAQQLSSVINRYTPTTSSRVANYNWQSKPVCYQRIQLVATSLATIARADRLYKDYLNDERLSELPLCIAPPIWLENNVLDCHANFNGQGNLACNVKPLAPLVETRNITHAIVVSEQGKANVQNGVMYLDISDSYTVMVHELAHFAGFIDEYALSRNAARRYCSNEGISTFAPPNLTMDGAIAYHPQNTVNRWETKAKNEFLPLRVGFAKTCGEINVTSYKPSRVITFMEHHDSGVIPDLYLSLWQDQLANPNAQRPISMNLFQAFHQNGETNQAGQWLAAYENHKASIDLNATATSAEDAADTNTDTDSEAEPASTVETDSDD